MSITLRIDTWKIQFDKKIGIAIMSFVGILLLLLIVFNIILLSSYDVANVQSILKNSGIEVTKNNADAYVRLKVIFTIVGNTVMLGLFSGLIWWSINSKSFGYIFGVFWLVVFGANAIGYPFYTVEINLLAVIIAVLNAILAIGMLIWIVQLMQHRTRLKQALAKRIR